MQEDQGIGGAALTAFQHFGKKACLITYYPVRMIDFS